MYGYVCALYVCIAGTSEWFILNVCIRISFKTCLGSPVPFCGSTPMEFAREGPSLKISIATLARNQHPAD